MITYLNITGGILHCTKVLKTPEDLDRLIADLQEYDPDYEEEDDTLLFDDGTYIALAPSESGEWLWDIPEDDPDARGVPLPELRAVCGRYLQAPQVIIEEYSDHTLYWSNVEGLTVTFQDTQPYPVSLPEGMKEVYDVWH